MKQIEKELASEIAVLEDQLEKMKSDCQLLRTARAARLLPTFTQRALAHYRDDMIDVRVTTSQLNWDVHFLVVLSAPMENVVESRIGFLADPKVQKLTRDRIYIRFEYIGKQ